MPGARCTRSLACKNKIAHEVVTTGSPEQPGIPRTMVLTVSFVTPVIGLFCHRRRRNYFRQLDASVGASGPHGFAVRGLHRSSCVATASTASRPAFRDDREPPLLVRRDRIAIRLLLPRRQANFGISEVGQTAPN